MKVIQVHGKNFKPVSDLSHVPYMNNYGNCKRWEERLSRTLTYVATYNFKAVNLNYRLQMLKI